MDSLSGFVVDAKKCSQLSMTEKRELVHQIFEKSKDAFETLNSFSRVELNEIICAETGKKRKYTGYTKSQMIEHLRKLVSQKSTGDNNGTPPALKKQKNAEALPQLQTSIMDNPDQGHIQTCLNVACKANLKAEDIFCKRCSCCICHSYDDNKDTSMWLTCGSEPPDESNSCGMSCHVKCALTHARSGITKIGGRKLDGFFYCISCDKVNGLMSLLRKQLLIAKDARRVDELCLRISTAEKILKGTEKFKDIHKKLKAASKLLKAEVGPVESAGTRMVRGLVNRLSCGAEVQKLCDSALKAVDSFASNSNHTDKEELVACGIHLEVVSPTSVIIQLKYGESLLRNFLGCRIWHRPVTAEDYPELPTFIVIRPETRFVIPNLIPSTEYICKVSVFSKSANLGVWEAKWATRPASSTIQSGNQEVESIVAPISSHLESTSTNSSDMKIDVKDKDYRSLISQASENTNLKKICSMLPSTPCKPQEIEQQIVSFECKRRDNEADYDFSVRAVKWLEQMGSINEDFRVKFLTWFSLKATRQERRVVSVFVDTLVDDPKSLAGQLIHSFTDKICIDKNSASRICTKLWH